MDLTALLSAFGLVFVAELGDKTQLAVVTQTCKYRRPWAIFAGASAGLAAVTTLGVVAGQALSRVIPADLLQGVAAAAFVVMGLIVGWEALRQQNQGGDWDGAACGDGTSGCEAGGAERGAWSWQAFAATLGLLFVAELGDKTQLAVLSLSTNRSDSWAVLTGSALALTAVTGLGVVGGQALCDRVPRRTLLWASALAFIGMGAWMGLSAL